VAKGSQHGGPSETLPAALSGGAPKRSCDMGSPASSSPIHGFVGLASYASPTCTERRPLAIKPRLKQAQVRHDCHMGNIMKSPRAPSRLGYQVASRCSAPVVTERETWILTGINIISHAKMIIRL